MVSTGFVLSELFARLHTSLANFSASISKNLEDCELYAVAISPSFCMVTDKPKPNPVPSFSIETPFELMMRLLPPPALNPEPVTSQPLSVAMAMASFKNSTDSSTLKSSNLVS